MQPYFWMKSSPGVKRTACLLTLISTASAHALVLTPNTTLTEQTSNNTTASDAFTDRYDWYLQGMTTGGKLTINGDLTPSNISKISVHNLLYPGATTKVFAHYVGWFITNPNNIKNGKLVDDARILEPGEGHVDIGYTSIDQTAAQLQEMKNRGYDGVVLDWYGPSTASDLEVPIIKKFAEASNGTFEFGINIDKGAIPCSDNNLTREQCVSSLVNYVYNSYMGSPAYMKGSDGHPLVDFFLDYSSVNWALVRPNIPQTVDLVMGNTYVPSSYPYANGGYAWALPRQLYQCTGDYETYPSNFPSAYPSCSADPFGFVANTAYYQSSVPFIGKMQSMAAAYKGFDDAPVNGWNNCGNIPGTSTPILDCRKALGQQCGLTWLGTFQQVNNVFSTSNQLASLQLVTWDDYEEGTELETGIDNCMSSFIASYNASTYILSWNPTFGSDQYGAQGNESTVDHYVIYASTDGQNLMNVQNVPVGTHFFNVLRLGLDPGNYKFYVQAVGKPNIVNHMSNSVSYTAVPTRAEVLINPIADTTLVGPTLNVTALAVTPNKIVEQLIYLDNVQVYTTTNANLNTNISVTPGKHSLTVQFEDSSGWVVNTQSIAITAPAEVVSSPVSGATVVGPSIHVIAQAVSGSPVTESAVYLDGVKAYSNNQSGVDFEVPAATGTHALTVKFWNSTGIYSSPEQVVVVAPHEVVTAPTSGQTINAASVVVNAEADSGSPVTESAIYLDGNKVYTIKNSGAINTTVSFSSSGKHFIGVQFWNTTGGPYVTSMPVYVNLPN